MRISDWSSDVCSSDLVNIARIDIVAAGVVVGRLLTAEPAGILEFPSHGTSPSLRPTPCRRLHATNRDPGFAPEAAAARRRDQASRKGAAADPSSPAPHRPAMAADRPAAAGRSEEHTSELQSLMRISYAVFCLKKKQKIP